MRKEQSQGSALKQKKQAMEVDTPLGKLTVWQEPPEDRWEFALAGESIGHIGHTICGGGQISILITKPPFMMDFDWWLPEAKGPSPQIEVERFDNGSERGFTFEFKGKHLGQVYYDSALGEVALNLDRGGVDVYARWSTGEGTW